MELRQMKRIVGLWLPPLIASIACSNATTESAATTDDTDGGEAEGDGDGDGDGAGCGWIDQRGTAQPDRAAAIALGPSNAIYAVGNTHAGFEGQTALGESDAILVKWDTSGTFEWARQIGTSEIDEAASVSTDTDGNVYVAGFTRGSIDGVSSPDPARDCFIAKYGATGDELWIRQFGSDQTDECAAVAHDGQSAIYLAGSTSGEIDGQEPIASRDVFVAKFDEGGVLAWAQLIGSLGDEDAGGIAVTSTDIVYVAGWSNGDFDGQTQIGSGDAFISQLDAAGNRQWTTLFGTEETDIANAVVIQDTDGAVVTGVTEGSFADDGAQGSSDVFVAQITADGELGWTRQYGTGAHDGGNALAVNAQQQVYVAGASSGDLDDHWGHGASDIFVTKLRNDGSKMWTQLIGTGTDDFAFGISLGSGNTPFIAGFTRGVLAEGGEGNGDLIVANLCEP